MRPASLILLTAILASQVLAQTQKPATKIKSGDVLLVTVFENEKFSGEFLVLDDGTITGEGFGRITVGGKTIQQVQISILTSLRKRLVDPVVSVTMKTQVPNFVYLVNAAVNDATSILTQGQGGPTEMTPNMTLRQLLSKVSFTSDTDQIEVGLVRGKTSFPALSAVDALDPKNPRGGTPLQPGDVVILNVKPRVRIWVTGSVNKPGEYRVPVGTDVTKAIANSGGMISDPNRLKIFVRRGPELVPISAFGADNNSTYKLEAGDTVIVDPIKTIKVIVDGEVTKPGQVLMDEGTDVESAIGISGGVAPTGTLTNVLILRNGEVFKVNAAQIKSAETPTGFTLRDGDLVMVRKNERKLFILGEVKEPIEVAMEDNRDYFLADAVTLAKGIAPGGSLRRIAVARAGANGKYEVKSYNLDEFLKDGKAEANPKLQPDDVVFVGTPKGFKMSDVNSISSLLSGVLIIRSLGR